MIAWSLTVSYCYITMAGDPTMRPPVPAQPVAVCSDFSKYYPSEKQCLSEGARLKAIYSKEFRKVVVSCTSASDETQDTAELPPKKEPMK